MLALVVSLSTGCSTFRGGGDAPPPEPEEKPPSLVLQKIKHRSEGETTKIEIQANREFSYTAYSLGDPPRLAIEMPDMESEMKQTVIPLDGKLAEGVEIVRFPKVNSLRVEIRLKGKADYSIEQIQNKLEVRLSPGASIVAQGSEGSVIKKDAETRKSELEKQLNHKEERIQTDQTRLQRLSERLDMTESLNQSLVQQNEALKDKVKALHNENLELSALLKEKNFEVTKYRSLNATLAEKLKELEVRSAGSAATEPPAAPPDAPSPGETLPAGDNEEVRKAEEERSRKEEEAKRKQEEEEIRFEVTNRILSWRSAWTSKDLDAYMSHYSPAFQSGDQDWNEWRRDKEEKFRKNRILQVELGEIRTSLKEGFVEAEFNQTFRSDSYRDFGVKTLRLIREENDWKIVRESWTRKKGP